MTAKSTLLSAVLKALDSISDIITTKVDEATTVLFKEESPFCLVTETDIYLRTDEEQEYILFQGTKYGKTQILPSTKDAFLHAATKAYWAASGKLQRHKAKNLLNRR